MATALNKNTSIAKDTPNKSIPEKKITKSIDAGKLSVDDFVANNAKSNPTPEKTRVAKRKLPMKNTNNRKPSHSISAKVVAPKRNRSFDGFVDNRVIPDAGVPTEDVYGILSIEQGGHGLLRPKYVPSDRDVYISSSQIRRFRLRPGDEIVGPARKPKELERYWGLLKIAKVNGIAIEKLSQRVKFDNLIPVYPDRQIKLETDQNILATRLIDLISPIGKGQRGLIVSPPKAGKTTIMKQIAHGISVNHPEIHIMAVLVGERPEEVTDFDRSIKGEVAASNFDEPPDRQVKVAELALERAKRLVELGNDVVILLDSITRLARAYNLAIPTSGRTLSGGFDPAALYPPKRFFGAARNFEDFDTIEGKKRGSLTIIGTSLVDTGSRMDDLVYEEFKGTGNMELHLDRTLAERRIFPAVDVQKSGTRQDALLYGDKAKKIKTLITMIDMLGASERTEILSQKLIKTKTNEEFLDNLGK